MRRKHRLPPAVLACLPVVTFLGVFFVVPLALNGFTSLRGADGSFSLVSYARLLSDSYYLGVTANTLWVSAMVTLAALVIGYPVAWFIAQSGSRLAGFVMVVVILPLFVSVVVRSFGWLVLLGRQGLVNQVLLALGLTDEPMRL